jgi:signal transduction histidine kinase
MEPDTPSNLALEGLVHDLNNVFETIADAAELLAADPDYDFLAAALRRSVLRGRRIVEDFTASALGPQDFAALLDSAIEFARDLFQALDAPPVEFHRQLEPGIRIRGSFAAWERVLVNLFVNAAQAMKEGGAIEVSAREVGDAVEISVADSGPGIPAEILPEIFKPHFSTKSPEAGLGLHIVQSIVAQNGGVVTAANRADPRGAVFSIRLPRA